MSDKKYSIFEAIPMIMADMSAIGKNQKNQMQGFKYRGIDDMYNAIHPLLAKYGVFSVPKVISHTVEERTTAKGSKLIYRVLEVEYTFYASDGSSITACVIGEGMDSGDKAANKAMSVAHKYAFFQVFAVATEDIVDPDAETHPPSIGAKDANNKPFGKSNKPLPKKPEKPVKQTTKAEKPAPEKAAGNGQPDKPIVANASNGIEDQYKAVVSAANGAPKSGMIPKHVVGWMREANKHKKAGDEASMADLYEKLQDYLSAEEEEKQGLFESIAQLEIF